jgi:predicted RecB family nuclease
MVMWWIGGYHGMNESINGWKYKKFICNKADLDEEFRIMNEFMTFIQNFEKKFYWCAERRFWDVAERRQFDRLSDISRDSEHLDIISDQWKLNLDNWIDMCNIFKSEPIVIKDCFNFGLKNIANAMYKHKLISTKLDSECSNGLIASVNAWNVYQDHADPTNSEIMKDIIKYNEFDCKVLWDILRYLRKNH